MAATVIGTAYLFAPSDIADAYLAADGSTSVSGLTSLCIGFTPTEAAANSVTETDLAGNVISERRDDDTITANITLLITAASTAWPITRGRVTLSGLTDTRFNKKYLIESVSAPINRGAHIQYELSVKTNSIINT